MQRTLLACFLILFLAVPLLITAQSQGSGKVYVIHMKGEIDGQKVALLHRALENAEKNKPQAIIVELDTFGGRVDAAAEIRDKISALPVETICYIKNRAWSAGALIAIAHKHIAIVPGGSIGAAEPIPGTEKNIAALKAEFAATANKTGRNPAIAEAMVDKKPGLAGFTQPGQILALTDYQAKEAGYADIVAPDLESVLKNFGLSEAGREEYQTEWTDKAAAWLANDTMKAILLAIVFLTIFTEIKTAGLGIASLFGLMAAGLFFLGQYLSGSAGWLEIMLFLSGIMLFIMEIFVPGFGLWGISGMGCIFGSFFLALGGNTAALGSLSISLIMAIIVFLVILKHLPASRLWHKLILKETETTEAGFTSGHNYERYMGKLGITVTLLRPAGMAEIDGEQLDVVSEGSYLERGTRVKVVKVTGNRIIVKAVKE